MMSDLLPILKSKIVSRETILQRFSDYCLKNTLGLRKMACKIVRQPKIHAIVRSEICAGSMPFALSCTVAVPHLAGFEAVISPHSLVSRIRCGWVGRLSELNQMVVSARSGK